MRLDDDNTNSYAPVLRRIFILVIVITAVPVMLWTITAFMRTYVAQPVIKCAYRVYRLEGRLLLVLNIERLLALPPATRAA